jgi:hypothetical protein
MDYHDKDSTQDVESIKMNYKAAKNRRLPFFIELGEFSSRQYLYLYVVYMQ